MTDFRKVLEENRCPVHSDCGAFQMCMCSLVEDAVDEIDRLRADNERLLEALQSLLGNVTAPHTRFETGCCMCGDDVENHPIAGHFPIDSGVYHMTNAIDAARAALDGDGTIRDGGKNGERSIQR